MLAKLLLLLVALASASTTIKQACINRAIDTVFVLDSSGSVGPDDFEKEKQFVINIVNELTIGAGRTDVRVALVVYSTRPQLVFDFDTDFDKDTIIQRIQALSWIGKSTATGLALDMVRSQLLQSPTSGYRGGAAAVIVVSDGHTLETPEVFHPAVDALHSTGAEVYAFGVGDYVNFDELATIATVNTNVFLISTFDQLATQEFAQTTIEAFACTWCTYKDVDLAFILDASGSVSNKFAQIKQFAADFVSYMLLGEDDSRIAAIRFSTGPRVFLNFNDTFDKNAITDALLNIPPVGRSTATGLALDLFANQFTQLSSGRRPDTELVAILLTDGNTLEPYDEFLPAVERFHNTGVRAYTFGIGSEINSEELALIASAPTENHVFLIDSFSILQLQDFVQNAVLGVMCSSTGPVTTAAPTTTPQTTPRGTTRGPATTQGHHETAAHTTERARTTAHPETTQAPSSTTTTIGAPLTCARRTLDLVVLLDNSAGVASGWDSVIHFVQSVLRNAQIGRDATRVATVVYSSSPSILFSFSSSFIAHDVINNLQAIPTSPSEASDLVSALNFVSENLFAPNAYGYRGGAAAVLVVTGPKYDRSSILDVVSAAGHLQDLGADVFAVSVGAPSTNLAEAVASELYDTHAANIAAHDQLDGLTRSFSEALFCFDEQGSGSGEPIATATPTPTISFTTPAEPTTTPAITTVGPSPTEPATTTRAQPVTKCDAGVDNNGNPCSCSSSFCEACDVTPFGNLCTRCSSNMILYSHECVGQCPSGFSRVHKSDGSLSCEALCTFRGVDVALVIDSSSSISPQQYTAMLQFASDLVGTLPIGTGADHTRVALVNFASETDVELLFRDSSIAIGDLQDVVRHSTYRGGLTAVDKGLATAQRLFGYSSTGYRGGNGAVVLFSDGESCSEAQQAAAALKQAGIEVYTVGFGSEVYQAKLKALASSPASSHAFYPAGADAATAAGIVTALAKQLACADAPQPEPVTVATCANNKLPNGDACTCGPACASCSISSLGEKKCLSTVDCAYEAADIAFVLDVSDQLGEHQFPFVLRLLENIVAHLPVSETDTHVALLTYADSAHLSFDFKYSYSADDLGLAISSTSFIGGTADLTEALDETRIKLVWSSINGFRGGPLRVVVIGEGPIDPNTVAAATNLKHEGAELFAIGVGTGNVSALPLIITSTDHLFLANDLDLMTEPSFAALIARALNCPADSTPTGSPLETEWPRGTESPGSGSGEEEGETTEQPTSTFNDRPVLEGGNTPKSTSDAASGSSSTYIAIVAAVGGVALVAGIGFFIVKRQSKSQNADITVTAAPAPVIPPRLTKKKLSDVNFDLSWDNEFSGANPASLATVVPHDTAAGSIVRRNVPIAEEPTS